MTNEGNVVFETPAGVKIECTATNKNHASFSLVLGREVELTPLWALNNCSSNGEPCTAFDNYAGEISNHQAWEEEEGGGWTEKLGFVSGKGGPAPEVGVQYSTRQKEELLFNQIDCKSVLTEDVEIGASKGKATWTSTISPVNTMTDEFTQVYSSSAPGVQAVQGFEGKKPAQLEMFVHGHWEPVAMTATFHMFDERGQEAVEIKATK